MADSGSKTVNVPQDGPLPPRYQEQPDNAALSTIQLQPGSKGQPTQSGYPGQPAIPGQTVEGDYPPQQPHYQGLYLLDATQPGYPPQTVQSAQQASVVIMQPGLQTTQAIIVPAAPRPSNYIGLSIFTFLCCNWCIGLAALVYSCKVDSAYNRGDYEEASRNSNIAKRLNNISIVLGIIGIVIVVIRIAVAFQ